MIKHVVMWKFKEENKEANMAHAKEILFALVDKIPEIKGMEIYFDSLGKDMAMDMMLVVMVDNAEELATYAVHPEHLKVSGFIRSVVESRVVLDAEV